VITNFAAVWNRTKQIPWNSDEILEIINHFEVEERKPPPLEEYLSAAEPSQLLKPESASLPVVPPAFKEDVSQKKPKKDKNRKLETKVPKEKKPRKQKQEVTSVAPSSPSSTAVPKPKQPFDAMVGATYEEAKRILKELKQNPDALFFLYPIDRKEMFNIGCGDYFSIIKQPMDFETITKKLNLRQYRLLRHFAADIRLIFDNARIYNRPQSETQIYEMADRMSELFEQLYQKVKEKLDFPKDYDPPKVKTPEYFMNVFQQAIKELYPNTVAAPPVQTSAPLTAPTAPPAATATAATTAIPSTAVTGTPATATATATNTAISTPSVQNNVNVYNTKPTGSSTKKRKAEENAAISSHSSPAVSSMDKSNVPLSDAEKIEMKERLNELTEQQMLQILEIIKPSSPIDSNEIEIDLETLPIPIQRQLQQFILEATSKNKSQLLQMVVESDPPTAKRQRVDHPDATTVGYSGINGQSRENGAVRTRSRVFSFFLSFFYEFLS
jgi:hypothetical protein